MKKNLSLKLIANVFIISLLLNTVVVVAHILSAKDFTFDESVHIFLLTVELGVLIFTISGIVLFFLGLLLSKMKRTKAFWLLMIVGITISVLADRFINTPLGKYNEQTGWIAAIAAFSILVSLSSQYQLFVGGSEDDDDKIAYN